MLEQQTTDFTAFFRNWFFKSDTNQSFSLLKLNGWYQSAAIFRELHNNLALSENWKWLFVGVKQYSGCQLCFRAR